MEVVHKFPEKRRKIREIKDIWPQCGYCEIMCKNYMKSMDLLLFSRNNFLVRVNMSLFHSVLWIDFYVKSILADLRIGKSEKLLF